VLWQAKAKREQDKIAVAEEAAAEKKKKADLFRVVKKY
jgi:hypothetical protein